MVVARKERGRGERGASLVEYALLVALIAVVCLAAVTFLGRSSSGKLDEAGTEIDGNASLICYNDGSGGHYYYDPSDGSMGVHQPGTCPSP